MLFYTFYVILLFLCHFISLYKHIFGGAWLKYHQKWPIDMDITERDFLSFFCNKPYSSFYWDHVTRKAVNGHFDTVLSGSESRSMSTSFHTFLRIGGTIIRPSAIRRISAYNHTCVMLRLKVQLWNDIMELMTILILVLSSAKDLIQRML